MMTDELEYLKQRMPLPDYLQQSNWTARRIGSLLCQCFQESVLLSRLWPWRRPDPFYRIIPGSVSTRMTITPANLYGRSIGPLSHTGCCRAPRAACLSGTRYAANRWPRTYFQQ